MQAAYPVHENVFDFGSVNSGESHRGTEGVEHCDVAYDKVLETSLRNRTELDAVGARTAYAILYQYVAAHMVCRMALETEYVVRGVYVAVAYDHVFAVHNVDAVVVPV